MRTFYVTLLVEIVVLAQANDDECEPFAVKVSEATTVRQGADAANKSLSLKQFLETKTSMFHATHGIPRKGDPEALHSKYCTPLKHGQNCGGFKYTRTLDDGFEEIRETLFQGVSFKHVFIGYNWIKKLAIEYTMTFIGSNKDHYIFEWFNGTELTAHVLRNNDHRNKVKVEIPNEIENILKSRFALYSYKTTGYNLYVTCDGTAAWVTYPNRITPHPENEDPDLEKDLSSLKKLVETKTGIKLEVKKINRQFPSSLTEYLESFLEEPTTSTSAANPHKRIRIN